MVILRGHPKKLVSIHYNGLTKYYKLFREKAAGTSFKGPAHRHIDKYRLRVYAFIDIGGIAPAGGAGPDKTAGWNARGLSGIFALLEGDVPWNGQRTLLRGRFYAPTSFRGE